MDLKFVASVAFEIVGTLLLFALLISCRAKWRQNTVVAILPILFLIGWLADATIVKPARYSILGHEAFLYATLPLYLLGFILIAWNGGRRLDQQQNLVAAQWPRPMLFAAFVASMIGLSLTFTNFPR